MPRQFDEDLIDSAVEEAIKRLYPAESIDDELDEAMPETFAKLYLEPNNGGRPAKNAGYWRRRCVELEAENKKLKEELKSAESAVWDLMSIDERISSKGRM